MVFQSIIHRMRLLKVYTSFELVMEKTKEHCGGLESNMKPHYESSLLESLNACLRQCNPSFHLNKKLLTTFIVMNSLNQSIQLLGSSESPVFTDTFTHMK